MLDSNDLSGQIPEQLLSVPKYNFTGNNLNCGVNYHHLCTSDNADQGSSHKPGIGLIVGIVTGLVVILFLGCLLFFWYKGCKREVFVDVPGEIDRRITFGQIKNLPGKNYR
ncbi:LRR receptor serine/threonine-protein kinase [Spatholobus suberectus]|nr:LRR receptor serine/threonine-protein kinase [Spatholobus suberectus]